MNHRPQIDFSRYDFHPVVVFHGDYTVFDFTQGYDEARTAASKYGVGRYNERRPVTYTSDLFADGRNIHMGIDLAAPVGTPVHAFADGKVFAVGYNAAAGDYGYTLITQHELDRVPLYALHGHLAASVEKLEPGAAVERGAIIAHLGDRHENGNWPPHVHFQLSWDPPTDCDLPGVVSDGEHAAALAKYPDPRLVLGPLYEDEP
ncbi:MAG: peptidoglycan DD-metalloendopeptidase family protein [Planctomycetota bacterium]